MGDAAGFYTVAELAGLLGSSTSTIYEAIHDGRLRIGGQTVQVVTIGRTIRVPAAPFDRLISPSAAGPTADGGEAPTPGPTTDGVGAKNADAPAT